MKHRTYMELLDEVNSRNHTPEELRELHKELKKYGDGIMFMDRYPDFPFYFSVASLVVVAVIFVVSMLM